MTGHLTPERAGPRAEGRCSTITSTAGCGRRPSRAGPGVRLPGLADDRRRRPGALVQPRGQAQRPRALPGDVRPHRRRDAAPGRHRAGRLRVRPGPRRRRRRLRRGAHGARAVHRGRADARRGDGGDPRRLRQGLGGDRPDDLRHRHGHAHGGAQPGDRRAGRALARRRRRRLRHRRRRGRLPADAPPRRVPVRDAGELPHHDPCRRGVRAAVDLGGGAVVRRRAAGPRRAHRRRHHRADRQRAARPAGRVHPRHADPARAVPDVERQHGRRARRSPSTRSRCCAGCGSGSR